jgi:hypothetical protein
LLPDTTEAKKAFEADLDRFLYELGESGFSKLVFSIENTAIGLSSRGKPVHRGFGTELPWNTMRVETSIGYEDWTDIKQIDFARYEKNKVLMKTKGDLINLIEEQYIHHERFLPDDIKEAYEAFKLRSLKHPEREHGFLVIRFEDGGLEIRPIEAAVERGTLISSETIMRSIESATNANKSSPRQFDIFHSHPDVEGVVSTSLSGPDLTFGQALEGVFSNQIPVNIHASPIKTMEDGVFFSSKPLND